MKLPSSISNVCSCITTILSINTHSDPLVPHSDTIAASVASERGEIWFRGSFGHCAPASTDPEVYAWLAEKLQVVTTFQVAEK